jgi:N-acetylneuraminic acid mutarotase
MIGGYTNPKSVQSYNTNSQQWTIISSSVPMNVENSACIVLPNEDVLVVGSENFEDFNSAAIYNVANNVWTKLDRTTYLREGTDLVRLGNRIFVLGGLSDNIEEFHQEDNSWTLVSQKLIIPRIQHNSMSLPAETFPDISGGCQGVV